MAGCTTKEVEQVTPETEMPYTYTENFNNQDHEMTISSAPKKAVSMSQFTTEILLTLGLEDQMAGTAFLEEEIYSPLADAYKKVPVLSEKWPAYEVLMGAEPDFVTGWAVAFSKRGVESSTILQNNIPIYVPNSTKSMDATLDTLFVDMIEMGKIFDASDRAQAYVKDQQELLKNVQKKIQDLPEKRVFIFDSEDEEPFTVYEGFTTNLLSMINAKNILSGKGVERTWGKASWEEIIQEDPEYIIVVDYGTSIRNTQDFDGKVASLKANPILKDVTAVKENQFIRVKLSEIVPGVRNVEALERLAETIHGVTLE
ncbi:MAG: ABC transporter substrate-binding protein [Anaeromicrobium sp.]|jgi:iron complex transport system substrate-binding protein|uniref:ABC transporter substrate-binding protein n=1 Tax=Anaeromicrobium sp. TaxID=1929132 RepID=UPI0025FD8B1D|nr:ABC transporter substrate-binding protein [Anaeromicrobium sp.]MCT4593853.1 ABC transporter substrate-binding protein [Anaeromicrobium sp.]